MEESVKRPTGYSIGLLMVLGLAALFLMSNGSRVFQLRSAVLAQPTRSEPDVGANRLVVAPGRVEPVSEEIEVGAEINGKLQAVLVEEGSRVRRGQVIALLENGDYRARVTSAQALIVQKEAELRRVINGARDQERREALAAVTEAAALMEQAHTEMLRRQSLHRSGTIAREEAERAERQHEVSRSRYEAAMQRHELIIAPAREEDRAKAEADVVLARALLDEARAQLEKTIIRSPIAGLILRKHLKAGESVSNWMNPPSTPIVTVADAAILRVRADVDETDVGKVKLGHRTYVTADAYGNRKFWGRVVRIGQVLGKKRIRTEEPTERVDTKILETLIELEKGAELPLGLRVDAFILVGPAQD
jgi:multidrug resistance efflux pump